MATIRESKIYSRSLTCNPVTTSIGAEVSGLDLKSLSIEETENLYRALVRYRVLFLRDQDLDLDLLCDASRNLGELMRLPYIEPVADYPEVIAVLKEADEVNMGVFGGDWHSDFSFLEAPPMGSLLYAVEVPPVGGDTVWVDMAHAFAALPADMRSWLMAQNVVHTGKPYGKANAPDEEAQFKGSIKMDRNNSEADRETLHPAVCRHPDSGEPVLFINPTYTTRFESQTIDQSEPVLKDLYAHCTRPEFTCRYRWAPGTVAIWDNRSTLHYAVNDYDGYRRLMYRTTLAGTKPLPYRENLTRRIEA